MSMKTYKNDALTLEVQPKDGSIEVAFLGKSTARDPGAFISPLLAELMQQAKTTDASLTLDFRRLEYMNSSTITPVIRALHEAKGAGTKVTVLYDGQLRWQELSFSALKIFQTDDKRIEIRGG